MGTPLFRVIALVLALLLAACGGGSAATGGTQSGDVAQQGGRGATAEPSHAAGATAEPENSPTDAPAPSGDTACKLITNDEVKAAVGRAVSGLEAEGNGDAYSCVFRFDSARSLTLWYYADRAGAAFMWNTAWVSVVGNGQPVSGIADKAVWNDAGGLYLMKNGKALIIALAVEGDGAGRRAMSEKIARAAVARM